MHTFDYKNTGGKKMILNLRGLLVLLLSIHSLAVIGKEKPAASFVDPLDNSCWAMSKWISVADAPTVTGRVNEESRAADGSSWFVCTLNNSKKVIRAKWMTTALGVYQLYVNGKEIGSEVLKPGFTHCLKTKRSFTYDITDAYKRKSGESNILSAQVTPGWWADKIITPSGNNGMYGTRCAFRGVLELTYADGKKEYFGTDVENWKAGIAGPVRHAAIFDGEEYDAREKMGYEVTERLGRPEENTEFNGVILPTNGAEIYLRDDLTLSPVRTYIWKKVEGLKEHEHGKIIIDREYPSGRDISLKPGEHLVVDFGQNCAAVPSFVFKAEEGVRVSCLPAEILNDGNGAESRGMDGPEGSVHRQNLRIHHKSIRLDYTFADTHKVVEFVPKCTFFGYRYLDITATGNVTIKEIKSIPVSSITQGMEIGMVSTGSELINRLISNTVWGMRSNYLSVPTDCPQRNERLGWTADTQVFTATGTFFANTNRFFHKWLHDLRDSQSAEGGYPGVAPFGQYGSGDNEYMRVGWADAGIIVPWTVWKQFGDQSIITESWASMERYMDHVNATKYDHQALSDENGNYQWADWLSYEPLESCSGRATRDRAPLPDAIEYWNFLCASYWAIDAVMMRDMAAAIGQDTAKYEQMIADAKSYLKTRFLNEEGEFKTEILNTMQTPALFALKNGIVEGEAKERMKERLKQNFSEHDNCMQTGFLGTSILMSTLTENGMTDIAYDLLFQRKNPSWIYSIDNGATTLWERWNSYTTEKGMGPRGMNSFNHYAYGAVCQWIWETAAGIKSDPSQPGFQHIIMSPVPDKRLGNIKAEYQAPNGVIKSAWHYKGDEWVWTFTIPNGSVATVTLPGESTSKTYTSGTYTIRKKC